MVRSRNLRPRGQYADTCDVLDLWPQSDREGWSVRATGTAGTARQHPSRFNIEGFC